MTSRPKTMRQLSEQIVRHLRLPAREEDVVSQMGQALTQVRGRTVRLRKTAFPPGIASGLWVDRAGHDLIAYEENTDPEHQIVIIGHEAWHMFQGHCSSVTTHGPAASRAEQNQMPDALAKLVAFLSQADETDLPPTARMDAALHFAARADARKIHEELQAEHFGFRFATDVQAALAEARTPADLHNVAGRIKVSMAHHVRRT
ncbi:hypothetical protein RKE30_21370 [Streptomyces sp. Li-HN-5-11]|uniref:hypothetical protein n=1 Tax=Streptomyces sp. Li-HN-5-11 TaxID=3075432 RepID=UPI0028A72677|nr:hypothetical protein [Streptomyces sp. Li-HN-5-11]WNM32768.1 hypothetical protein RKE30_21370 [Streptomyces sp. Li-HN-5-11]